MLLSVVRVFILFALLVVFMRLMGKRQLGEMQPYEFIITLVVAELACIPMADPALPLSYGIVPMVVLLIAHYLLSFLSRKSMKFRKLVDGQSIIVINPEGVDYNALKKLNMTISDLLEVTINQGYFDLSSIYMAFFQTNGKLVIIPTAYTSPPTSGDLQVAKDQTTYALPIIMDGKALNLDKISLTTEKLSMLLQEFNAGKIEDIIVATLDDMGKMYIKPKAQSYICKTVPELAGAKKP